MCEKACHLFKLDLEAQANQHSSSQQLEAHDDESTRTRQQYKWVPKFKCFFNWYPRNGTHDDDSKRSRQQTSCCILEDLNWQKNPI